MLVNVQQRLQTEQAAYGEKLTRAQAQHFTERVADVVREALQPYGYYQPSVNTQVNRNGNATTLDIMVNPGAALRIDTIDLRLTGAGEHDKKLESLLNDFPLKSGQILTTEDYDKAKQHWLDVANSRGYLRARLIEHKVTVNLDVYTAEVVLHLDTGPRYKFGKVTFADNPLRKDFLARYVDFKPGEPYSPDDVLDLQRALVNSPYFQNVVATPQMDKVNNQEVPIDISLVPRKKQQYIFGVGVSTDTGPRVSLGWNWRRVNSRGHQFQALTKLSRVQNSFTTRYIIPGKHPATDRYTIGAGIEKYRYKVGETLIRNLVGSYVSTRGEWQRSMNLSFQVERSNPDNSPAQTTRYLIPSINWIRVHAENPIYTRDGDRLDITLRGAAQNVISDTTFFQAEVNSKIIRPIGDRARFILRSELGYTAGNNLTQLPLSLQFLVGGAQSIRGFDYRSIPVPDHLPGVYKLIGSGELQFQVKDKWHIATFYDTGSAFYQPPDKLKQAAGVGLVYVSPIGPLELTAARPIDNGGRQGWKIQFTMGPDL